MLLVPELYDIKSQTQRLNLQYAVLDAFDLPGKVGQVLASNGELEAPAWRTLLTPQSFVMPLATAVDVGGVRIGSNLIVDVDGTLHALPPLAGPRGFIGDRGPVGPAGPLTNLVIEKVNSIANGMRPTINARIDPTDPATTLLTFNLPEGRPGVPGRNPTLLLSKDVNNRLRLGTDGLLYLQDGAGGGSGVRVTISAGPPKSAAIGDLWFNELNFNPYVYSDNGTGGTWKPFNGVYATANPAAVPTGLQPPAHVDGQLWFKPDSQQLMISLPGTGQWQPLTGMERPVRMHQGLTPPLNPVRGDLWFRSDLQQLFTFYVEPGSVDAWVPTTVTSTSGWSGTFIADGDIVEVRDGLIRAINGIGWNPPMLPGIQPAGVVSRILGVGPVVIGGSPAVPTIGVQVANATSDGLMSAADKAKLNAMAPNAEQNVQADWGETSTASDSFIKNKPSIQAPLVVALVAPPLPQPGQFWFQPMTKELRIW